MLFGLYDRDREGQCQLLAGGVVGRGQISMFRNEHE